MERHRGAAAPMFTCRAPTATTPSRWACAYSRCAPGARGGRLYRRPRGPTAGAALLRAVHRAPVPARRCARPGAADATPAWPEAALMLARLQQGIADVLAGLAPLDRLDLARRTGVDRWRPGRDHHGSCDLFLSCEFMLMHHFTSTRSDPVAAGHVAAAWPGVAGRIVTGRRGCSAGDSRFAPDLAHQEVPAVAGVAGRAGGGARFLLQRAFWKLLVAAVARRRPATIVAVTRAGVRRHRRLCAADRRGGAPAACGHRPAGAAGVPQHGRPGGAGLAAATGG